MDQSPKSKHLEQARRHVAEGEKTISRQRKIIAELEGIGRDTTVARQLLETFEITQAMNVREAEQLEKELQPKPMSYASSILHFPARSTR